MNAKTTDKLATIIFVSIACMIVLILAGLLGYIVVHGFTKISLDFFNDTAKLDASWWWNRTTAV